MLAPAIIRSRPWALTPDYLDVLVAIADSHHGDIDLALQRRGDRQHRREAVYRRPVKTVGDSRVLSTRDNVAILEVNGVIFRYASLFEDVSGGASVQTLAREFQTALELPRIDTILLLVDSPGGEIDGIHAFAQMVYAARTHKRLVAYVDGDACSAGYWIASAASEIVVDLTARLGSIGVRMRCLDPAKADDKLIELTDDHADLKMPDPNTDAGLSALKQQINDLAAVFRADVCQFRGCTESSITRLRADVRVGQAALDAGLADRVGSLEGLLDELTAPTPTIGIVGAVTEERMTDTELQTVLVQASPEEASALLDANKLRAEILAEVHERFVERDALITAQGETIAKLEARIAELEGSEPLHLGYRASVSGAEPSATLMQQEPVLDALDVFLDGK